MDLLLKREQRGERLNLFAKLELTPDEADILNKSQLRDDLVWPVDPISDRGQRNASLLVAGLSALSVWIGFILLIRQLPDDGAVLGETILSVLLLLIVSAGIVVCAWVYRFLRNHFKESVSVSDLVTGRDIQGNEETLRIKEQTIRAGAQKVSEHIAAWKAGGEWGGSPERIRL